MTSSRRDFFRQLVDRTLGPAADAFGDRLPVPATPRTRLRPPGAIAEARFLDTCYRCGNCVDVCPAKAIHHVKGESDELNGTPFIVASQQPCLVCDGLECMHACPSGALQLVAREDIRMGVARVDAQACVRSKGQDCQICVEVCPMDGAIAIDPAGLVQVQAGCTGCGICEWKCPADAIVVQAQP